MSNKMQDLEERIMSCWSVVDDIKEYLRAEHLEDDRTMNFLIGMQELYQVKFENLWNVYEQALREYYDRRQVKDIHDYLNNE